MAHFYFYPSNIGFAMKIYDEYHPVIALTGKHPSDSNEYSLQFWDYYNTIIGFNVDLTLHVDGNNLIYINSNNRIYGQTEVFYGSPDNAEVLIPITDDEIKQARNVKNVIKIVSNIAYEWLKDRYGVHNDRAFILEWKYVSPTVMTKFKDIFWRGLWIGNKRDRELVNQQI